ncbi:PQQ-binding-like beta-propeller repeat protein [bacterium]|nr:PQQ-binding-like beta-propeller repeat protein [candidate division CSSED10-310 bacterium]
MYSEKSSLLAFFLTLALLATIPGACAEDPLWTYSSPGDEIGGVTISSDGSAIAVAGGKIWLFSKEGTLLAKEPYGDQVIFTPDGSFLISSYSDTLYKFKRNTPSKGSESPLQKIWETSLPGPIRSIDVSDDGNTTVASLNVAGVYIFDSTGKMIGGDASSKTIIRISSKGDRIFGASQGALCRYSRKAVCKRSEEGIVGQESVIGPMPDFFELANSGSVAVFNQGPRMLSVFPENNTLRWNENVNGDITSLAMTPSGSGTLVGTENGNTSLFDQYGNLTWNYESNPTHKQSAKISSVALSKEGTVAAAGSYDGKIIVLNSTGGLILSNQTKDHIQHIVMSADGSVVVATGDNTVYAFSISKQSTQPIRTTIIPTTPARSQSVTTLPINSSTQILITQKETSQEITTLPTEYSVIRTPKQSPLSGTVSLIGLLIALLMVSSKR